MSSSSLLSLGSRALNANQAALQVVGHNIANVNTPGYSRQTIQFVSAGGQMLGSGYFGKGVDIAGIERSHSAYLTRDAARTSALSAADDIRAESLQRLEGIFPGGSTGLGAGISSLFDAFSDVASTPTDLTARAVVLNRATEMVSRFKSASRQLDDMEQGVRQQMSDMVGQINTLSSQIASVNAKVTNAMGNGLSPNDLLDQREQLIHDLNRYVRTDVVPDSSGALNVFVAGSQALVLGKDAHDMSWVADEFDPTQLHLAVSQASQNCSINEQALGGGQLSGLVQFRDQDLVQARNLMGRLALTVSTALNAQHELGIDLSGNTSTPLFQTGQIPDGLPSNTNTGNATVGIQLSDNTALEASDYEVRFDANALQIVRLSDGLVRSFTGLPARIDGLDIQITSGAAQLGDRYLIRPFHDIATGLQTRISSPRALAMANPVWAVPAASNSGDLGISSLQATHADVNLTTPVTLNFTSNGQFNVSGTGTGNPQGIAYQPGSPIEFNGWKLVLQGVPRAGDVITVQANTMPARNAGNAMAMMTLRDQPSLDGAALTDAYANLLASLGSRVQGAQDAASISHAIANNAEQARNALAGVNLDEEATRLLQYQQSYQAAAKILQVAQSAFDSLLNNLAR